MELMGPGSFPPKYVYTEPDRPGVSNTRAACGPPKVLLWPAILFPKRKFWLLKDRKCLIIVKLCTKYDIFFHIVARTALLISKRDFSPPNWWIWVWDLWVRHIPDLVSSAELIELYSKESSMGDRQGRAPDVYRQRGFEIHRCLRIGYSFHKLAHLFTTN